jgi:acyl-CoA thioesterase-1
VTNVGIGGERTDQALKRLDSAVIARQPHVVTIMYGTNDSYVDAGKSESRLSLDTYRDNLREIVTRLRKAGAEPILMTEPRWGAKARVNGAGEHPNVRLNRYVEACREVANETGAALVDHFAHWSEQEAKGQDLGEWTTDQCHPNPAGHRILLEQMLPAALEKAQTAGRRNRSS